ncbi:MAG: hypothetical protein L3K26_19245 [Candidatus Hydrogenedentes bacterium]|nr:hypothetical protein [Candidatus Hydrogenedentota bacterium]
MLWDKNEDEAFPNRHPNEPGGLRQDILDEIADHLACAGEREREKCEDSDEKIERRVLHRFGNPNAIARRLWWGQMRETVMREWIKTGVMVVLALAIVVFLAVVARQLSTANQTVLEALRANLAITDPMVSFSVRVARGSEGGKAASGLPASVSGRAFGEDPSTIRRETDSAGQAQFGPMQPGTYNLSLRDSLSGMEMGGRRVTLFAGENDEVIRLVAPGEAPHEVKVVFDEPLDLGNDRVMGMQFETKWQGGNTKWLHYVQGWFNASGQWGRDFDLMDEIIPPDLATNGDDIVADIDWQEYMNERFPLLLSGDIVSLGLTLYERTEDGRLREVVGAKLRTTEIETAGEGSIYHVSLPPALQQQIDRWRAEDHAEARGIKLDSDLWNLLRRDYADRVVDSATRVERTEAGFGVDGSFYRAPSDFEVIEGSYVSCLNEFSSRRQTKWKGAWSTFVALPEDGAIRMSDGGRLFLAVYLVGSHLEEFDNDFELWPVLNSVLEQPWPQLGFEDRDAALSPVLPELGEKALLTLSSKEMARQAQEAHWFLLDVTDAFGSDTGGRHPTALMMRWERNDIESNTNFVMVAASATKIKNRMRRPLWLVLEPSRDGPVPAVAQ